MTESHGFGPHCVCFCRCVFMCHCFCGSVWAYAGFPVSSVLCVCQVRKIKFFSRCGCPVRVGLWVIENPDGYAWASRKKMLLQERKSKYMFWNGPGAHLCLCTPLPSLCSVPFSPLIFPISSHLDAFTLHSLSMPPTEQELGEDLGWLVTGDQ